MRSYKPDFLYIGVDRGGSKWLHRVLYSHPNVLVPRLADPYYFDRNYEKGWDWYAKFFLSDDVDIRAVGELSHDYLFSEIAARRIHSDLPDVKILATLRQPLEKAFSVFGVSRNAGEMEGEFSDALLRYPSLLREADYAACLRIYFELFPRNKIHLMKYDDLRRDPRDFARAIFAFLDVPFVEDLEYEEVVNAHPKPHTRLHGVVAKQSAHLARAVGMENVLGWAKTNASVRRIFYGEHKIRPVPELSRRTFEMIREGVDRSIISLNEMAGLDCLEWLDHERYVRIV